MYIPKHFEEKDRSKLISYMREYNFAAIINSSKKKYWATHIPFLVVESVEGGIILRAHMAKSNPQWANFKNDEEVLVIFQEPHAYISPSLYESRVSVPTWNYIAVHAYGVPKILPSIEERIKLLEETFEAFEPKFKEQWVTLPDDYRNELLEGIVAFEISVTNIEGKFKLSQNRTGKDREKIIEALSSKSDKSKTGIAEFMRKEKK